MAKSTHLVILEGSRGLRRADYRCRVAPPPPLVSAEDFGTFERRPAYISSATQSVVITLAAVDDAAYSGTPSSIATNLTTSDPSCSGSPLTCTVSAPAVAGSDTFTVVMYDQAQSSSTPAVPSANVLSRASTVVPVTAGAAKTATALTLDGVVASVVLSLGRTIVTGGTSTSVPLTVSALDAGGKLIIGDGGYLDANGDPLTMTG